MALDENIIFKTIFSKHGDKSIEFVMQEVAKAKNAYAKAQQDFADMENIPVDSPPAESPAVDEKPVERAEHQSVRRLTKRSLKYPPETAIGDEIVTCCICGAQLKFISTTHLKMHGTTPQQYRKICGYSPKVPLMSKNYYKKMQETIAKAQQGRAKKNAASQNAA